VSFETRQASTSEVTAATSSRIRFFLPSAGDFVFIILIVAMCSASWAPRVLGDGGIGWHIRNGELMLRTHSITRSDPFSATMNGQPWYTWEWLYDLLIARIHQSLGLNGVVFVTAVISAATFALALRISLQRGALLLLGVMLLALAIAASSIHLFARPHVLSWLFALLWFQSLDAAHSAVAPDVQQNVFWLPPLMLLWANLHGGFVLGFVLLGLYFLCDVVTFLAAENETSRQTVAKRLRLLANVTALSLVASLVNPFGYKLHVHVFGYLSNRWLMNHIDEFLSPNFHGLPQECFAVLLLITFAALAVVPRKPRLSDLLITVFAGYSGLYASRNLPVSSLLLTVIVSPFLSSSLQEASANPNLPARTRAVFSRCRSLAARIDKTEVRFRGHLWPVVAVLFGAAVCLPDGRLGAGRLMNAHFDGQRFPVEAVEFIVQREVRPPILAPDYWGGYLVYRLYPRNQVFVDDRHDFYGDEFLKTYLKAIRLAPDWNTFLERQKVNCVLVPPQSSLANMLKQSPPWRVVYEDKTAVLLER
jgi:hypothetical protein